MKVAYADGSTVPLLTRARAGSTLICFQARVRASKLGNESATHSSSGKTRHSTPGKKMWTLTRARSASLPHRPSSECLHLGGNTWQSARESFSATSPQEMRSPPRARSSTWWLHPASSRALAFRTATWTRALPRKPRGATSRTLTKARTSSPKNWWNRLQCDGQHQAGPERSITLVSPQAGIAKAEGQAVPIKRETFLPPQRDTATSFPRV